MAKDWEWKDNGIEVQGSMFIAQRGAITLVVWADPTCRRWSFEAGVTSPGEDEVDGVRIACDETYATKELAQLAAIEAMRVFVEQLHADFRGAE